MPDHKRYRFNGFTLDTSTRMLVRRSADGSEEYRTPRPQSFELLAYLLRYRDYPVSKKDLCAALSRIPGKARKQCDDQGVDQALLDARRALDEDAQFPIYIQIPQCGFLRFIHPVAEDSVSVPGAEESLGDLSLAPLSSVCPNVILISGTRSRMPPSPAARDLKKECEPCMRRVSRTLIECIIWLIVFWIRSSMMSYAWNAIVTWRSVHGGLGAR